MHHKFRRNARRNYEVNVVGAHVERMDGPVAVCRVRPNGPVNAEASFMAEPLWNVIERHRTPNLKRGRGWDHRRLILVVIAID